MGQVERMQPSLQDTCILHIPLPPLPLLIFVLIPAPLNEPMMLPKFDLSNMLRVMSQLFLFFEECFGPLGLRSDPEGGVSFLSSCLDLELAVVYLER